MPAQLFLAFADEDRPHLDALVRHLAGLERAGVVAGWHEGRVLPGATVAAEVEARIEAADVLVLLISADFLASDRCYALIERALARHDDGRQRLVPVIVRPCPWQPVLGGLRVLPPDDRAVTLAPDRDAAWLAVVDGLRAAVTAPRPTLAPALAASPYRGLSAFEPGDEALFFGREDLTRRLWRRLDAQVRREGAVRLCAVVGCLWDARSGKELARLEGHTRRLYSVAFSPDGARVLTASDDGTARLWDAKSGKELARLEGHADGERVVASFGPDGTRVVTASHDKTARVWDAQSGKELIRLEGHTGHVESAAFSPDGTRIVTASWDTTARVWDAQSGKELIRLQGHAGALFAASFSPDGTRVLTSGKDVASRLWDAASGKEVSQLKSDSEMIWTSSFSPDGKRVVTAAVNGFVRLWDAASGKELASFSHNGVVWWASLSPDGTRVVTADLEKTARIWDARSGKELLVFEGHQNLVWSAAFSHDGERVVTASEDRTARIWDARSGRELARLEGHGERVSSASFSPDGERVVTAGDQTARIWDVHLEARPPEVIGRLVRCYVPLRLEGETIVRAAPSASDCPSP